MDSIPSEYTGETLLKSFFIIIIIIDNKNSPVAFVAFQKVITVFDFHPCYILYFISLT